MKYKKTAFIFVSKLCRKYLKQKTRLKRLLVYDRDMYSSKTKEDFARLHIY